MRAADWKRLANPVLAGCDSSWGFAKALAYLSPVGWIVHGVLAEDSGSRTGDFYLWVVQMPLVAPLDGVIDLSWSDRFGGSSTTYSSESAGLAEAISGAALEAASCAQEGSLLLAPPGGADSIRMQEARAYGLALSGNELGALEVLRRVQRYDATFPWEDELLERSSAVASLIESGRLDEVTQRLDEWRRENCDSLGLRCD